MSTPVLSAQEYLGRTLCMGRDARGEHNVIVYALTGRSASSRARRLEETEDGSIRTTVTDSTLLERGNPKLLIYRCVRRLHDQWFVGNGLQTDLLVETASQQRAAGQRTTPLELLVSALRLPVWIDGAKPGQHIDLTSYEPDAPTYTPRISGVMDANSAAMVICKRRSGEQVRSFFEVPMRAGQAHWLSTYTGRNVPPGEAIPSFQGEPVPLEFPWESPEQTAEAFYQALGPKTGRPDLISPGADFRVGVAALFVHRTQHYVTSCLLNTHPNPSG